jgi:hypothetical protein
MAIARYDPYEEADLYDAGRLPGKSILRPDYGGKTNNATTTTTAMIVQPTAVAASHQYL